MRARKMMTRIAAAVCTYDRYDALPRAVESLLAQTPPSGDFGVLVVDNSPDHEKARAFGARYVGEPRVTYLVETTPGLSNARNVATGACGAELLAFMDDDAVASPDWLARIVEAFETCGPDAAVVGGKVVARWQAPRPPWLRERNFGYLSLVDWGGSLRVAKRDEWLAGTNLAYRVEALRAAGGFSTLLGRVGSHSHLLSNEEIELAGRIRARGRSSTRRRRSSST